MNGRPGLFERVAKFDSGQAELVASLDAMSANSGPWINSDGAASCICQDSSASDSRQFSGTIIAPRRETASKVTKLSG